MYSRQSSKQVLTLLLAAVCSGYVAPVLSADSVQLSVVPDKCISLLKGQTCYQRVHFHWKSEDMSEAHNVICLWREGDSEALTCWEKQVAGAFRYRLESAQTTHFYLVAGREQQPIIDRASVKVSWVYNNRTTRRSRWKLF